MADPFLETERLRLRAWQASDHEPWARMSADPLVMRYFPSTLTRAESDAFIERTTAGLAHNKLGFWALERKSDAAFLGFVGLNRPAYELPFGPCVEIGWRLAREAWGFGFATEAAKEALVYAFEDVQLPEVVSFTALMNERSWAVMQRLGMQRQPSTFAHPRVDRDSPIAEHCWYRMRAGVWRATE